jgi:cytochrome c-type protein NapC
VKRKKYSLFAVIAFITLGVILWGGFNTAMEATNTLEFCISCHEMESTVYQEYKHSVHYSNPSGVQATCPDCHVPREWTPKVVRKIQASNELLHWLIGSIDTPEKFEAKRLYLAEHVWQAMQETDSRECRNCHNFSAMQLNSQGRFAAGYHENAKQAGDTCIDCHKGISHKLPVEKPVAAEAEAPLDLDYGEEINETCAGCHGEFGEGTADGEYPRLAGLDSRYLARQLRHFKSRERINIPMFPYATERELPEEDVRNIAAYLASIQLPTKLAPIDEARFDAYERLQASKRVLNIARYPGNVATGQMVYNKECAGCHGKNARGNSGQVIPPLVGQHSQYLLRQVARFRKGERLHDKPRDADIFKAFSDTEIGDILAWLSTLDDT